MRVSARHCWLWLALLLLSGCVVPVGPARSNAATRQHETILTVFAAASLTEAFGEIGKQFQVTSGTEVRFNFAGSQQLARQLAQGAPADVFASASIKEMADVIKAGVIVPGSEQVFAQNRLVVIFPSDNPGNIASLQDLARPGVKLDLAAEQVPAGQYSQQVLAKMAADAEFGTDFKANVNRNIVSFEENVKVVVTKVSLGEADAGIVYRSDITAAVKHQLGTLDIPEQYNQLAAYPIAPTKQPPAGAELAQRFVDYVVSAEGQAILERYNFETDVQR